MSGNIILHVRKKYFDQIKSGEKKEEYRIVKPYWIDRLRGFPENIFIINGYPKNWAYNPDCFIKFPFKGFTTRMIKHEEFGDHLVQVFAIKLER
jgi:hypothetical protein